MEVLGLNAELIDVAVYTQQALEATARIAEHPERHRCERRDFENWPRDLKRTHQPGILDRTGRHVRGFLWQPLTGHECRRRCHQADSPPGRRQADAEGQGADRALPAAEGRIFRAAGQQRGWITNKNWVIATPMETGIAPRDGRSHYWTRSGARTAASTGPGSLPWKSRR